MTDAVLVQYKNDRHVTSFSWSPKGKQLVLAFRDSTKEHFSQFKLPINEKDLTQNIPFDEVKKISLPNEFNGFYACNIHWISTFTFMAICYKPEENDSHYTLVKIPSNKATGADAIIKVSDLNCINIDSENQNMPIDVNYLSCDNVFFTYTNRSSQLALIGCQNVAEVSDFNRWGEIALEDDSNLWLPTITTNDQFAPICGFALAAGTDKQIRFSNSVVRGGTDRYYALVYTQHGHLTLFMCDYDENISSALFFPAPSKPATLIKPTVSSSVINQSSITNASSNLIKLLGDTPSSSLKPLATAFTSSSTFPSQSQTISFKASTTESLPLTLNSAVKDISFKPEAFNNNSSSNTNVKSIVPTKSNDTKTDQLVSNNQLYEEEIRKNVNEFSKEIETKISSQRKIITSDKIGSDEEFEMIKNEFNLIQNLLNNLTEQFEANKLEVDDLLVIISFSLFLIFIYSKFYI